MTRCNAFIAAFYFFRSKKPSQKAEPKKEAVVDAAPDKPSDKAEGKLTDYSDEVFALL